MTTKDPLNKVLAGLDRLLRHAPTSKLRSDLVAEGYPDAVIRQVAASMKCAFETRDAYSSEDFTPTQFALQTSTVGTAPILNSAKTIPSDLLDFDAVAWRGPRELSLEWELKDQLQQAAKLAGAEKVKYAVRQATRNRKQFALNKTVIDKLVLRTRGKQAVEIWSAEELKVVAAEPFVFFKGNSLRTGLGQLKLHFWPLTHTVVQYFEVRVNRKSEGKGANEDPHDGEGLKAREVIGELGQKLHLAFELSYEDSSTTV